MSTLFDAGLQEPHVNRLWYGDNLTVMTDRMKKHSVDLIYLDPPFNSNRRYNLLYSKITGLPVPEQDEAFCDTWELTPEKEEMVKKMPIVFRDYGVDEGLIAFWKTWIDALRHTQPKLLAYMVYMSYRLLAMRSLLKPTGSLWLHCDPTAGHYVKVMLDGIFGHRNFRNEIIWCYTGPGSPKMRQFNRKHDTLFWYSMGKRWTFNRDDVRVPHKKLNTNQAGAMMDDALTPAERDEYLRIGKVPETWWTEFSPVGRLKNERLGYPTQKPIALLSRIIEASSNEGDVVFDPFCGCGTTIYAASALKRRWIGCDIAWHSVRLVRDVLKKRHGLVPDRHYQIQGVPLSVDAAQELFERDPHQFQCWSVELAGGFASNRRSGDAGVDGRIHFETDDGMLNMVISVKGGRLQPAYVRELRGVLERESSSILGGFICLRDPTRGMKQEAAQAGMFEYKGVSYERLQIRTVEDLLDGRGFDTPTKIGTFNWMRQAEMVL